MTDKTRESNFWKSFKSGVKHLVMQEKLELNRVENAVRKSMADVEGILKRRGHGQFWIELKTAHRPKRTTTPIRAKWQDGQSRWLERRWGMGGNSWLLIQVGKFPDNKKYLIRGCDVPAVEQGVPESKLMDLSVCLTDKPTFEDIVFEASLTRSCAYRS